MSVTPRVGCWAYSRTHKVMPDVLPIGGVIVDVHDRADPETGAVDPWVVLLFLDKGYPDTLAIPAADIDEREWHGQVASRRILCDYRDRLMAHGGFDRWGEAILALSLADQRRGAPAQ